MHFKTWKNFRKEAFEILNLPEPEYYAWMESVGFKSLRSWIRKANEELDELTTEEELNDWLTKYNDILEIRDDEVRSKIQDTYILNFADRKGKYYIEDAFVQGFPDKTVTILNGNLDRLSEVREMNKTNIKKGVLIDLAEDISEYTLRSGCVDISQTRANAAEKRRVVYTFRTIPKSFYNGYLYTSVEISEKGQKRNIFKNWKDHAQKLKWMECSWQVTDNNNITHTVTDQTISSQEIEVLEIGTVLDCMDDTPSASYIKPNFNYQKGKATSDRLNWDRYAVICCGFPSGQCPAADG